MVNFFVVKGHVAKDVHQTVLLVYGVGGTVSCISYLQWG